MNRTLTLISLAALTACGATHEIDDPGMEATAVQVGSSSATLSTMPTDDDATAQSNVQTVGGQLQSLVTQHQAYASVNDVPDADRDALEQDSTEPTFEWDGSHLVYAYSADDAGSFVYDVDLNFASGDGGTTIDGRYNLDFHWGSEGFAYDYTTHATYDGVVIDSAGCASDGSVSIDWDVDFDFGGLGGLLGAGANSGASKGTVAVFFEGCDAVRVEGT